MFPFSQDSVLGTLYKFNATLELKGSAVFFQSSPPPFSPKGRTNDIDAILYCIEKAEKFIYISVMDYFPLTVYTAKIKYVSM